MTSSILLPSRIARGLCYLYPHSKNKLVVNFGRGRMFTTTQSRCSFEKPKIQAIISPSLPAPIGPYSHATRTPFAIYCSGQLPADLEGNLIKGTIRDRTSACLQNLREVLLAADSALDKIVKVQIFLTDMNDFVEMNKEYEQWIKHAPARSCVAVKQLPKGVDIEIECVALP